MNSEHLGLGYTAIRDAILRCTRFAPQDLDRGTTLTELGLDSLGVLELMLTCEADLGVDLLSEEAPALRTVGDVGNFIDRRLELLRAS